jgi:hypothetical protein
MTDDIQHFTPGTPVEALDPISRTWRRGTVMSDAPLHTRSCHTGGAYVNWVLPIDTPQEVSRGGWQSQNTIRLITA